MRCIWIRRRLGAYVDGALDDDRARATAAHLAACSHCRIEAESVRHLRLRLRRTLLSPPAPDWTGFWTGVVRGIEDSRRATDPPVRDPGRVARLLRRPRLALGGALAAAVVSATIWLLLPAPGERGAVLVQSASTERPAGTVMVYSPPEHDLAVVWVVDLEGQ